MARLSSLLADRDAELALLGAELVAAQALAQALAPGEAGPQLNGFIAMRLTPGKSRVRRKQRTCRSDMVGDAYGR